MILVCTPTNEPHYRLFEEENLIANAIAEPLLKRTKQKGRGKALKTLLAEAENQEANGEQEAKKRTLDTSSDEEEKPRKSGKVSSSNSSGYLKYSGASNHIQT